METGTLKFWGDRGFGFIAPDRGGKDVFCHANDLRLGGISDPRVGDRLEFDVEEGRDGRRRAVNVRPLRKSAA